MRNGEVYSLRDLINIDHQNYIFAFKIYVILFLYAALFRPRQLIVMVLHPYFLQSCFA